MKTIQLRDIDGEHLLLERDYELIRECFSKTALKIDLSKLYQRGTRTYISRSYRKYNPAYFEEILLNYNVDERVAMNYRERFIIDSEATYQVL